MQAIAQISIRHYPSHLSQGLPHEVVESIMHLDNEKPMESAWRIACIALSISGSLTRLWWSSEVLILSEERLLMQNLDATKSSKIILMGGLPVILPWQYLVSWITLARLSGEYHLLLTPVFTISL